MRLVFLFIFISFIILSFPLQIYVPKSGRLNPLKSEKQITQLETGAFHVGPDIEAEEVLNYVNFISPFWYTVMPDGTIIEHEFSLQLLRKSKDYNVDFFPLVNLSNPKTNQIVDEQWRGNVADEVTRIITNNDYDGIIMDFEGLEPNVTHLYAKLLQAIKAKVDDKVIMVCLFPQINWPKKNKEFLHPKGLVGSADYYILMAYDLHWPKSQAGEIAPLAWVEENIKDTLQWIPANQLILGMPAYGYDWSENKVRALGQRDIAKLKDNLENTEEGKIVYFDKAGILHKVYYEPISNIEPKYNLAERYGLKGIIWWHTGHSDKAYEKTVSETVTNFK